MRRLIPICAVLACMAACSDDPFQPGGGGADPKAPGWESMNPVPIVYGLSDVDGSGAGYIFAPADYGVGIQFGGGEWTKVAVPNADYQRVWVDSDEDVYLVGWTWDGATNAKKLFHVNARAGVSSEVDAGVEGRINNVWGRSSQEVYAAAARGIVSYFDGTGWNPSFVGDTLDVTDVWATAPDDVYAVNKRGGVFRYNGVSWSEFGPYLPEASMMPTMIEGAAGDEIIVSGFSSWRFDGTEWTWIDYIPVLQGNTTIHDLHCAGPGDYYAVDAHSIVHCDGTAWRRLTSDFGDYYVLRGVWADADGVVYAAGDNGDVWRYHDGSTEMLNGARRNIWSMWGSSRDNVYAAGDGSEVLRFDGSAWQVDAQFSLGSHNVAVVWGSGPDDVYAAQNTKVMHYDGTRWTPLESDAPIAVESIWGAGPGDVFFGGTGGIAHYDGARWSVTPTPDTIVSIWGVPGESVYAASEAAVYRYDGNSWIVVNASSETYIDRIWGRNGSEIYAGGNHGLYRLDGSRWVLVEGTGSINITDIWGPATGDELFLAGRYGIHHYDGEAWHDFEDYQAYSVWGATAQDVFAGGRDGLLLRYVPAPD